jgi:hypothetical protein
VNREACLTVHYKSSHSKEKKLKPVTQRLVISHQRYDHKIERPCLTKKFIVKYRQMGGGAFANICEGDGGGILHGAGQYSSNRR